MMREEILSLLSGQKLDKVPAFSGLIHITAEGLEREGLSLNEAHHDAGKMARAAASTFKLTGMPSAALPLDLCAPAEVLGAELRYYEDKEFRFPQVGKVKFESTKEITISLTENPDILNLGRLSLICEAIRLVKQDIGSEAMIAGTIPGVFTLLLYVCRPKNVFIEIRKEPEAVSNALILLADLLAKIGNAYLEAGADFITIHEMGGSPGFIGPKPFENQVLPALQNLTRKLPAPRVLSVCGRTNTAMGLLAQTGADAISVDQLTDLGTAREALKDTLLFGNIDPVQTLWQGDEAQVHEAVSKAKEAGVDALWPGCDLVPQTSIQNIKALMKVQ
jgi:[methyl-Co(III) methanol-specific corrinoid protein]:coenzyme M methyltransferase